VSTPDEVEDEVRADFFGKMLTPILSSIIHKATARSGGFGAPSAAPAVRRRVETKQRRRESIKNQIVGLFPTPDHAARERLLGHNLIGHLVNEIAKSSSVANARSDRRCHTEVMSQKGRFAGRAPTASIQLHSELRGALSA
jgi:hypothetical protein